MWVTKVARLTAVTTALVLCAAGLVATQAWADKPPAKDAKAAKLDGTWQVTAVTKNGAEDAKEEAEAGKLVLSGDTFVLHHAGKMTKGTFKADATQSPATLDLEVGDGGGGTESLVGIYELDGDTLRFCMAHKGTDRPTKFESTAGSGLVLVTLKRVKE